MVVLFREMRKREGKKGFGGWKSLNQEVSVGQVKSEVSVNYCEGMSSRSEDMYTWSW